MSKFTSDSSVSRILKNGVFTALRMGIYTVSGIVLIPFLMKSYSSSVYGLIALAGFLTQYVGLISGCIGKSVARYLNVALNQNDWKQANEIFSTAIIANIAIMCIQLPLFAVGVWKLDWLIDFPAEVAGDFRILVICNIIIFFINMMSGVFMTPIYASNRLDIFEKLIILSQFLRVGLLFLLVTLIGPKLWVIGVVDLGISLGMFVIGFIIYRKLVHGNLAFRRSYITKKWIRPVLDMAGWSLVSSLGFALFTRTDVWMINRFVHEGLAGVYAALLVWPNLVKQVGGVIGNLVAPVLTIDFAKGDHERMRRVCLLTSQLLSFGAAYGCGVFIVAAPGLIELWLGESYVQYTIWVQLLVGQLALTISGSIIWNIFVTIGKTKYMGVGNIVTGTLNILLSMLFIRMGYGVIGVVAGSLIALFLKENILFPLWVSKETGIQYRKFLWIYLKSGLVFGAVMLAGYFVWSYTNEFSFLWLAILMLFTFFVAALLSLLLSNREEKDAAFQLVRTALLSARAKS